MSGDNEYAHLRCPECHGTVTLGSAFAPDGRGGEMVSKCGNCDVRMVVLEYETGGAHVIRDPKIVAAESVRYKSAKKKGEGS